MPNPTGTCTGPAGANALFIRRRSDSATDTMELTDMLLNGSVFGSLTDGALIDDGTIVGGGSGGSGCL